jgi:hypothetical protein
LVHVKEVVMADKRFRVIYLFFFLVAVFMAGCSESGAPRLIAAFPLGDQQTFPQPQPPPAPPTYPQPQAFVYYTRLGIEAWHPGRAADRAIELAAGYGGYLVSSHAWRQAGEEHLSLVLAVPVYNFDALYSDIQGLGKVVSAQVWGEWVAYDSGGVPHYSQVTLEIAPRGLNLPAIFPDGWNPGRTFSSALRVSVAIFRTLLDAFIWLVVVAAPFILIFLVVRFVVKKLSRQRPDRFM